MAAARRRAVKAAVLAAAMGAGGACFVALGLGAIGPGLFDLAAPRAAETRPERRSGTETMSEDLRAMQADDTANPGMLWVAEGARLWDEPAGAKGVACVGCHGAAETSMRGVATRFPALDARTGRPIDLGGRINLCRGDRQGAPPFAPESDALLSLSAFVAHQSRGLPVAPPEDAALAAPRAAGEQLYTTRLGQLSLSCAECHDGQAGRRLGGNVVPEAHPTGYPLYRLEWQTLGSLQRRIRNCMIGVRAEPFPFGAAEMVALELYLMSRAAGMPVETPAVRP